MQLKKLRQEIVRVIDEKIPELASVSTHPGRFDLSEIEEGATLPVIKVALMASPRLALTDTGEKEALVGIDAFVITKDEGSLPKDDAALDLVEKLLVLIPEQRWGTNTDTNTGITGVLGATNIRAENLFSEKADEQNFAMWLVSWEQPVRLDEEAEDDTGVVPKEVYVCYNSDRFGEEPAYTEINKAVEAIEENDG